MTGLVEIILNHGKRNCDLCAVALFLVAINYALDLCAHMGGA
jgi:hypothetical protein